MRNTKIEWCDATWNPITGCRHGCQYCYAASIANRFCGNIRENKRHALEYGKGSGLYILNEPFHDDTGAHRAFPFGFAPTFHRYRLGEPAKLNGRTIFVGSMCDLFGEWVPEEWLRKVFESCLDAPQHNYLFLTKNPKMYERAAYVHNVSKKQNGWFGMTVTKNADLKKVHYLLSINKKFISFEPLLEELHMPWEITACDWFIIGAETGNHANKVIPKKEWIDEIVQCAKRFKIPVFMKDSLIPIVGEENMLREFPPGLQVEKSTIRTKGACMKCGRPSIKKNMVTLSGKMGRDGGAHTIGQMCRGCLAEWLEEMGRPVPEEWRASGEEAEKR